MKIAGYLLGDLKNRFADNLKHSRWLRVLVGSGWVVAGLFSLSREARLWRYVRGLELASPNRPWIPVLRRIRAVKGGDDPMVWAKIVKRSGRYERVLRTDPRLTRSIVLKAPGARGEKGVLLLYFEYNLARLLLGLSDGDLKKVSSNYHFVFASSWSPTDYALLMLAATKLGGPLFIQVSNHREERLVKALHPSLICTGSLPCDWVNPEAFVPKSYRDRQIDIIMVANWGKFKRHWEFFGALRDLPEELSVTLIGQREGGRDMAYVQQLARAYGVRQRLTFHESLGIEKVRQHLCDAKIAVIFSRREGGCVAAVEALFAGCALGMRMDAHVGSACHINERTGLLLRPGHLADDLMELLNRSSAMNPRGWAKENISHVTTLNQLNGVVRDFENSSGRPWSQDLKLIEWRPYAAYSVEADQNRLADEYKSLNEVDPNVFGGLLEQFGTSQGHGSRPGR